MRIQAIATCLLALVAQPARVSVADTIVVTAFPGNKGPGWKQSIDAAGAVGPKHVVAFDVVGFVARDKASGNEVQRFSAADFWQHVQPAGTLAPKANPNDSRILYDPLSGRWFACAAGTTEPDCYLSRVVKKLKRTVWPTILDIALLENRRVSVEMDAHFGHGR